MRWLSYRSRSFRGFTLMALLLKGRSVRVVRSRPRWPSGLRQTGGMEGYRAASKDGRLMMRAIAAAQKWPAIPKFGIFGFTDWVEFLGSADSKELDEAHRVLWKRAQIPPGAKLPEIPSLEWIKQKARGKRGRNYAPPTQGKLW